MTRVAMVVLAAYPNDPRVRREAEVLAAAGIAVDIICTRNPGEPSSKAFGKVTAHRVMHRPRQESLLDYLLSTFRFFLLAGWKLTRLSTKHRYDLFQAHNMPDYLIFLGFWHKLRGVPLVLDLHDLTVELFQSRWAGSRRQALLPLVRLIEALSCRFADHLITTSQGFLALLLERRNPREKVTLVMNTADPEIFVRPAGGKTQVNTPPVFLYHGTVAPRFGIHLLVDALGILKERGIECRVEIHGSYEPGYRKRLDAEIERLDLTAMIDLGGYLPLEEIRQRVARADVGVVPYIGDSFMDIAMSTKGFEYVAMGLPVIASRLPSMESIFPEDAVRYFASGDARDLADQMQFLLENRDRWPAYTARADEAYAPQAWPVMAERYLSLIKNLVSRS